MQFKVKFSSIILFLVLLIKLSRGYRILGIFPFQGSSHEVMFAPVMRILAERGHQVDVITHYPIKNPPKNYRVVVNLSGTIYSLTDSITFDYIEDLRRDAVRLLIEFYGNINCELLALKSMQDFISSLSSGPKYDAVIIEGFISHCYMGFAHILKVPLIQIVTSEYAWITDYTGHVIHPAFVIPDDRISFWRRLKIFLKMYIDINRYKDYTYENQTSTMRKYLHPDIPDVRQLENSVALTLLNSHPSISLVKPLLPSVIEVAGLHIEGNTDKLSPEMKGWLDQSKDGVVYLCFGSAVILEEMPKSMLMAFYGAFRNIAPVRVLMRVKDKNKMPTGLSNNVLVTTWAPQLSILNHKNTVAFITHGGLMGSLEGLYFGVPMIGIPVAIDQYKNVALFAYKNITYRLDQEELTEEKLTKAIHAVLHDKKYKDSAKYHSKLFRDRPMNATETAIFWIEYTIRNGPNVLRSPALNYVWWELLLIDVFAFIFLLSTVFIYLLIMTCKILLRKIMKGKSQKVKQKNM